MNKHQIFQTAILALLTMAVSASEVTLPNAFVAGQKARASEVNENFDAVKTAVDDNDARLTAAEGTVTDHETRLTAVESQVKETGAVSVTAHAFSDYGNNTDDGALPCHWIRSVNYGFFRNTGTSACTATAPVALPHGATVTAVSCRLYDNEGSTAYIYPVSLVRSSLTSDTVGSVFSTSFTTTSTGSQIMAASLSGSATLALVDNTSYAYYLSVGFDSTGLVTNTNLRLYTCKVEYTLG